MMLSAAMNARAEFYVWRDVHGVRQISNVPPRCLRGQTISPHCSSLSPAVADPGVVTALNESESRRQSARRDASRAVLEKEARAAAEEETRARLAEQKAQAERQDRIRELRRQIDDIKDAASLAALRGGEISVDALRRLDGLLAELRRLEGAGTAAPPAAGQAY